MAYDYHPRYCQSLRDFFSRGAGYWEYSDKGKKVWRANLLPTFAAYALRIEVPQSVLIQWTKDHPDFRHAWLLAEESQRDILTQNMLQGAYNSQSAIYAAKSMLGMRDTSDSGGVGDAADPDDDDEEDDDHLEVARRIAYILDRNQPAKGSPLKALAPNLQTDIMDDDGTEDG